MDTQGWVLDETAHAGEEHLDPDHVLGYDRKAGTDPGEDLAVLRRLGLNKTTRWSILALGLVRSPWRRLHGNAA